MKSKLVCVEHSLFDWRNMRPGAERRKAIIDHVLRNGSICVNRKYCPQIHEDSDLKTLLKKGTLKRERWQNTRRTSYTHLVLT